MDELGGVRDLQKSMERSRAVVANREAIAFELLSMATTRMTDLVEWDGDGNVRVKSVEEMPVHATAAINKLGDFRGRAGSYFTDSGHAVFFVTRVNPLRTVAGKKVLIEFKA